MTLPFPPLYSEKAGQQEKPQKVCRACKESLDIESFTKNSRFRDGLDSRCKSCTIEYYRLLEEKHSLARDEPINKTCTRCGITKSIPEFYKFRPSTDGRRPDCKTCVSLQASERWIAAPRPKEINKQRYKEWHSQNVEYVREKKQKLHFSNRSASREWYDQKLAEQGGGCGICMSKTPKGAGNRFHIDHNHDCCTSPGRACERCRRGLLCSQCNLALERMESIDDWGMKAIAYLLKYKLDYTSAPISLGPPAGLTTR